MRMFIGDKDRSFSQTFDFGYLCIDFFWVTFINEKHLSFFPVSRSQRELKTQGRNFVLGDYSVLLTPSAPSPECRLLVAFIWFPGSCRLPSFI